MKLSVLTENTASGYYTAEHGLSYFIEYAKKITGLIKVKAVIGGFHLMGNNNQTKKTIKYFKEQNITEIFPSHCTKFPALVAFYNEFKIKQVTTGMIFNF
jgi:7,8-dihydropterin-6-yl-methyl-4-(beta-D-ribofuranosyl)aminobenzene 5'-phosphate synthase